MRQFITKCITIIIGCILIVTGCISAPDMSSRAVRYARAQYGDFSKLIHVSVDTVTIGDNLDYRIEQAGRFGKEGRIEALDSLKASLDPAVLAKPTAYNCCVQYNYVGNFVWVQLDGSGNLLTISKDRRNWLLNPGEDAPGYLDIVLEK